MYNLKGEHLPLMHPKNYVLVGLGLKKSSIKSHKNYRSRFIVIPIAIFFLLDALSLDDFK